MFSYLKFYLAPGVFLIFLLIIGPQQASTPGSVDSTIAPVVYTGKIQTDKHWTDGAIRHAVGVHHYQVVRSNRSHPPEGGETGWTYNHQPYLSYWKNKFYLQYLSGMVEEHTPPTRTLLCTSADGCNWSDPVVVFPEYILPEIISGNDTLPAGTKSVMHQRMGFYVAPNGRLLTLAFYSFCITPRHSPNSGNGLGRVVREIRKDGSFGPVYFIRYNRHAGFNEKNTSFPFYITSDDAGFVEACDSLLADKLMTLQWWEEDRGEDGFFVIDPSAVQDPSQKLGTVTTSAGAGKALCFYHRADGAVVGIWKNQWTSLSRDEGRTWMPLMKSASLMTCGAKVWGQRTKDGKYALIYNHSLTRRNRFPLVVMTGEDGHLYDTMYCLQGEVPPKRYQGIHKNPGPQYVRGIVEGNGDPPGGYAWIAYSMNKEDIWVSRLMVPVRGTVSEYVSENFETVNDEKDLNEWSLYIPRWAQIGIRKEPSGKNNFLELRDEEPYDYAFAERAFPVSGKVEIEFRLNIHQISQGHALEIEVQDFQGRRPLRLRIDEDWLGLDHFQVFPLEPVRISTGKWYKVGLRLDCEKQSYDLALNDAWIRNGIAFARDVESVERIVFRTGPFRGDVRAIYAEEGEDRPAGLNTEDLPGADEKVEPCSYWIDDVIIRSTGK